jgi:hypothetical protein
VHRVFDDPVQPYGTDVLGDKLRLDKPSSGSNKCPQNFVKMHDDG